MTNASAHLDPHPRFETQTERINVTMLGDILDLISQYVHE